MVVFKILLIILIALPVIVLASYFYSQMLSYIRVKNGIENEAIRQSALEAGDVKRSRKNRKDKREKQQ